MKLNCFISFVCVVTMTAAQLTSPTRNYNVTSPVSNGPYVIGQILPCTYRLFSDVDTSSLILDIDLVPVPQGLTTNATMILIATAADVSKTDAFIKHDRNLTFFEHSINFMIPYSVRPGNYQVVFSDKATNTKLSIPIEIRPAASSTSSSIPTATSIPGRPQSSGSIFSQGSAGTLQISKALMGLVSVAGFVVFLL
ncbi:hypothetical protein G6F66_003731 [Rhizopus arrhizus]|nr:hypothetical protein G6F66_003731 [Rhizopus arrhizus]